MTEFSRKKYVAFAVLAVSTVLFGALLAVLGADLYLHHKFDKFAALNYRGYRGRVLGKKAPGELRLGIFGGSIAMGYGVTVEQSIGANLEQILNARRPSGPHVTVVNLASTSEAGPANFASSYRALRYLDLDVVALLFTEGEASGSGFYGSDIKDWTAFLRKVSTQDTDHARLIWSQVSAKLRAKIEAGREPLSDRELYDVLTSLNSLLDRRVWFDQQTLQRELGGEYADLMPKEHQSPARVNRIMMERLYPEIATSSGRFGQLPFSYRTRNWVFRRFGYWFILPTVLLEKYYQITYGSVTEGYRKDRLFTWLSGLDPFDGGRAPLSTATESGTGPTPALLSDSVDGITRDGRTFVFVFLPTVENRDLSAAKEYAQELARRNSRVIVADVRGTFPDGDRASYFTDGQHYSEKANRAVADGIATYVTADRLPMLSTNAR